MHPFAEHDPQPMGRRHHPRHHPGRGRPLPPEGGPRPHRHGRGRAHRGDIRTAVLQLLAEEPMHGYQLMQAIADRSGGRWTPSPGAIYPTISQLEDEGLVSVTAESGRKLVALTDAGREHIAARGESWPDPFAGHQSAGPGADLRGLLEQLHGAVREVGRSGTDAQLSGAARILTEARRSLYLLLAEGSESSEASEA